MGDARLTGQKQTLRLLGRETGEVSLEAVQQRDPTTRAAHSEDRNASFAEHLDVAQDRSLRHFELLGELVSGLPAAVLQHQQHVQHPRRTHRQSIASNMTVDVR